MNTFSIAEVQAFCNQIYARQVSNGQGGYQYVTPPLIITPYGYTSSFVTLAQNATQTNILQITANADFVALGVSHRAAISAAQNVSTKTAPFVRLLITDSGTNEQFTSNAIDLENYSSNGTPFRPLDYPRFVAGKSSLSLQVTNYAPTAETYSSIDIFMHGVLVRVRN